MIRWHALRWLRRKNVLLKLFQQLNNVGTPRKSYQLFTVRSDGEWQRPGRQTWLFFVTASQSSTKSDFSDSGTFSRISGRLLDSSFRSNVSRAA